MLYFDELKVGDEFVTPARTITEADVGMFAGLTGDYNQLHINKEAMKDSQFGERIVHGLLTFSISHGLMFQNGVLNGSTIAFAGIDNISFLAPVMFNDTVYVKIIVSKLYESKTKPDRGVAYFDFETINQNNVVVQKSTNRLMMKKKPI